MKKINLFSSAFVAALMLASCSANDDVINSGNTEGLKQYLSVKISNVGAGTRAEGDYTESKGTYRDGTTEETKLGTVRFYFFTKDGAAYPLSDGKSYKDVDFSEKTGKDDHSSTVEKAYEATMVLEASDGVTYKPEQMVVVANPSNYDLNDKQVSLNQLAAATKTGVAWDATASTPTYFVMSNATYVENNAVKFETTDLTSHVVEVTGNESDAETLAKNNAVTVYIERVAARVDLKFDTDFTGKEIGSGDSQETIYKVYGKEQANSYEGKDVYVRIKGWGIADENNQSWLKKTVNTSWTDTNLGFTWNASNYHRSYWETALATEATIKNHAYSDYTAALGSTLYTLPNTNDIDKSDNTYANTKVLVAAQLVDEDGATVSFGNYNGTRYLGESDMITAILADVNVDSEGKSIYYVKSGDEYNGVPASSCKLTAVTAPDYGVKVVTNDQVTVYKKGTDGNYSDATTEFNKALAAKTAYFYKDGMTYYHTSIKHLNQNDDTKSTYYGVVRNHVYDVIIGGIEGFGTPVYDPSQEIKPTVVETKKYAMAAKINVLSWRVVTNKVNLKQ